MAEDVTIAVEAVMEALAAGATVSRAIAEAHDRLAAGPEDEDEGQGVQAGGAESSEGEVPALRWGKRLPDDPKKRTLRYYDSFRLGGERFELGDCCFLFNEGNENKPFVMRMLELYETAKGEQFFRGRWLHWKSDVQPKSILAAADRAGIQPPVSAAGSKRKPEVILGFNEARQPIGAIQDRCSAVRCASRADAKSAAVKKANVVFSRAWDERKQVMVTLEEFIGRRGEQAARDTQGCTIGGGFDVSGRVAAEERSKDASPDEKGNGKAAAAAKKTPDKEKEKTPQKKTPKEKTPKEKTPKGKTPKEKTPKSKGKEKAPRSESKASPKKAAASATHSAAARAGKATAGTAAAEQQPTLMEVEEAPAPAAAAAPGVRASERKRKAATTPAERVGESPRKRPAIKRRPATSAEMEPAVEIAAAADADAAEPSAATQAQQQPSAQQQALAGDAPPREAERSALDVDDVAAATGARVDEEAPASPMEAEESPSAPGALTPTRSSMAAPAAPSRSALGPEGASQAAGGQPSLEERAPAEQGEGEAQVGQTAEQTAEPHAAASAGASHGIMDDNASVSMPPAPGHGHGHGGAAAQRDGARTPHRLSDGGVDDPWNPCQPPLPAAPAPPAAHPTETQMSRGRVADAAPGAGTHRRQGTWDVYEAPKRPEARQPLPPARTHHASAREQQPMPPMPPAGAQGAPHEPAPGPPAMHGAAPTRGESNGELPASPHARSHDTERTRTAPSAQAAAPSSGGRSFGDGTAAPPLHERYDEGYAFIVDDQTCAEAIGRGVFGAPETEWFDVKNAGERKTAIILFHNTRKELVGLWEPSDKAAWLLVPDAWSNAAFMRGASYTPYPSQLPVRQVSRLPWLCESQFRDIITCERLWADKTLGRDVVSRLIRRMMETDNAMEQPGSDYAPSAPPAHAGAPPAHAGAPPHAHGAPDRPLPPQ